MSEQEQVPSEEQLQAARDSTPEREEDSLTFESDAETPLTPESPEESIQGTPVRAEDETQAVEETASTEESEHEVVSPEGPGAADEDRDSG